MRSELDTSSRHRGHLASGHMCNTTSLQDAQTHKSGEALEENRLLRHEVKELRRLVDLLNDRNPVANLALDQVNQAFQKLY